MAKILFGGPQEKERGRPSNIHDDLVTRLNSEGHEVTYVTRGDDMLAELSPLPFVNKDTDSQSRYQLVIYDTGLFYGETEPLRRAQLFGQKVIEYLKEARSPVIVLTQKEMAELIRDSVGRAGFKHIDQPYDIEEVVREINSLGRL